MQCIVQTQGMNSAAVVKFALSLCCKSSLHAAPNFLAVAMLIVMAANVQGTDPGHTRASSSSNVCVQCTCYTSYVCEAFVSKQ